MATPRRPAGRAAAGEGSHVDSRTPAVTEQPAAPTPQAAKTPAPTPASWLDEPPLPLDAHRVAALLAIDPTGLGGVALQAPTHGTRQQWLALLRSLCAPGTPWRRLPQHASSTALLGGLDLGASLQTGQVRAQPGLLAQAHGGWVELAMAERTPAPLAAHLASVLDTGRVRLEREGLSAEHPARLALIALDQGLDEEAQLPAALLDRLAFHLRLEAPGERDIAQDEEWQAAHITAARQRLHAVQLPGPVLEAVCAASLTLGVHSLRAPLFAVRAARALAALEGCTDVDEGHASQAVRLVLAPRATRLPPGRPDEEAAPAPASAEPAPAASEPAPPTGTAQTPPGDSAAHTADADTPTLPPPEALQELLVQAALAALPPGLLAALQAGQAPRGSSGAQGRSGALQLNLRRGRPMGTRRGELRSGARLHLLDTLRAAAPWQPLRRRQAAPAATGHTPRLLVQREDFHIRQFRQSRPTTTVFVVDASGSSALHRLAEAKGAVERLLAECYVRRDRAAVIAFRGAGAELVLPPTRSLTRAKRSLAGLAGGGGTPLAAGLEVAHGLAMRLAREGDTPVLVLLTDGRANLARDGSPGRARASEDALAAARALRAEGFHILLIDTSPQPQESARTLARHMGARYVPLPHAGAADLSQLVRVATVRP